MPNQLVRDQWEYLTKMKHFLIKPGQPMGMALAFFYPISKFANQGKGPVCQKWNSEFWQNVLTKVSAPTPDVIPIIFPVRRN